EHEYIGRIEPDRTQKLRHSLFSPRAAGLRVKPRRRAERLAQRFALRLGLVRTMDEEIAIFCDVIASAVGGKPRDILIRDLREPGVLPGVHHAQERAGKAFKQAA